MICKQKLKLKKKNGFLEVRSENKLKWLGEWFGKSFFFFLDELEMSLGSLVGQNYRNTHNKQHTQLLVIVRLPVVARKRLGTVY